MGMEAETSMDSRLSFNTASTHSAVMPALVAGIHALAAK